MKIGELDKRLLLQSQSLVPDGFGGNRVEWGDVCEVWGKVETVSVGRADFKITHKLILRYRGDVDVKAGMRVCYGDKAFVIRSVVNVDEKDLVWEILGEEEGWL